MECSSCGENISDDSSFCPSCGAELAIDETSDPDAVEADPETGGNDESSRNITLGKLIAYPAGLLLIFAGLGGFVNSVVGGLLVLGGGVLSLPIVRAKLKESRGIELSRWATVAIVMVVVVAGAAAIGGNTTQEGPDSGEGNGGTQAVDTTATPGTKYQVGETFVVGSGEKKASYTITDWATGSNIGGQYGEDADGVFVVVEMEITNEAKESFKVSSNLYTLVDSQDRKYDVDTDAQVHAENSIIYEQLDPGVTKTGVVVFDVPTDQQGRQLKIEPAGFFSGANVHYVKLS